MRLDLANPSLPAGSSIYRQSTFEIGQNKVIVLGADGIVHDLVKQRIQEIEEPSAATAVASLYRDIPAHYVLIFIEGRSVTAVTDPYGIIKLYVYRRDGQSFLTDSFQEVEDRAVSIDRQALKYYFVTGYTPSKHTFFQELEKLEPCMVAVFEHGRNVTSFGYAEFGKKPLGGSEFLDRFDEIMCNTLSFIHDNYPAFELSLSGGIDSSFLFLLMARLEMLQATTVSAMEMQGLNQTELIDNDLDLNYSTKLALQLSKTLSVVDYDFAGPSVINDFKTLRDALGSDYAAAMGYLGYFKSAGRDVVFVNGQNADSVLSFGSMGRPRLKGIRPTGLNGLFSRHFQFFGPEASSNPLGAVSSLLRFIYYRSEYSGADPTFTRLNYFLGIGLCPENRYFFKEDPAYKNICFPEELATWFEGEYLVPLFERFSDLDDHALSVILYNRTYMQGSANRSTVLSALLSGKSLILPYASLALLELMTNLRPDWRYSFYGKYPNISVGRHKLDLPGYIIDRSDPVGCDSTGLLYKALNNNRAFNGYVAAVLAAANFDRYDGVLSPQTLDELKMLKGPWPASKISLLMRFVWAESILQKHRLNH